MRSRSPGPGSGGAGGIWHKFGNSSAINPKTIVMKLLKATAARLTFLFLTLLVSFVTFAQEGGGADIKVDVNKDSGGGWYTNPVVWIVGAAVFILLLVALLRGNRSNS